MIHHFKNTNFVYFRDVNEVVPYNTDHMAKILEESYNIEGQLLVVGNNDLLRFGSVPITPYRASTFGPNPRSLQRESRHLLTSSSRTDGTRIYVTRRVGFLQTTISFAKI